jgi:hypothetical protein
VTYLLTPPRIWMSLPWIKLHMGCSIFKKTTVLTLQPETCVCLCNIFGTKFYLSLSLYHSPVFLPPFFPFLFFFFIFLSPKSIAFSEFTSCSLVVVYGRIGELYCLHIQNESVSQTINHEEGNTKFAASFFVVALLGLVFDPEDGQSMFFEMSL